MDDHDTDITRLLESLASHQPAAPAIHAPGRATLSYADLGAQIRYVRERLGHFSVGRGDFVAGIVPLRPEMALACATLPAAATFVPLSPSLRCDVYVELLTRLRPKALLVPKELEHPARIAAQHCQVAELDLVDDPSAPAGMFTLELRKQQQSLQNTKIARPDWAYLMATSGTTGRAKLVPYSHSRVASISRQVGDRLHLEPNDVGCHLVPMHHSHGLGHALMTPLLQGASVVCLPESDIDGFFAALDTFRLTWITAVFSLHREILRCAPEYFRAEAGGRLRCIRSSAGRLDPVEIDRIEQTFEAPLLVGFGMTEVTPVAHETLPPHRRKRGSVGQPTGGDVAILNGPGKFCAVGDVGEIVVRGPQVFDGYFDDPKLTAAAFVDGWFRTGDLGYFDDDGYLFLQGRAKDMINRGGEKISPAEIDSVIATIPGVHEATTFAVPHRTLGEELAVAVVRDGTATITAIDVIDHIRQRMGAKRVPRQVYFVDGLPRTESGKVRRAELPRHLGLDRAEIEATAKSAIDAPSRTSPLEAALLGLWSSFLRVDRVGVDDDFFLLGGDSLQGARLLTSVKAVFGAEFALENLFKECATVAGMARAIEAARTKNTEAHPS